MHRGGYWGGSSGHDYLIGCVNYFDYYDTDEISIIELCHMVKELGYDYSALDFCVKVEGGGVSKLLNLILK